ncbi:NAD(P)H:quinone oxidoreductase [Methylophilaceae bacterium]|jgi:NAD(P)H dehydrogenase (quinone)|uniref:Flavoprotein WrbA n=1 Tax=Methylophilales bacterium HTCC2181 TaxID=383631 RepID=A0P7K4_9PROT|nr:tryptophan repressor binding protein [Methylophilales bacterium HTCC2181]MBT3512939.1 NAD(P)H:quinone oxidoreductase [Nitrosomonadales bacterium]MCH9781264.1 NAD(P)H:quinone oxidoreductase [Betaproteobacteria bacterium]MDA7751558.1 NAD(P)H:quinone oxidoreductase [Methylophilaceae bacterium]MBT5411641.1 NAD(P)H:quinone oxidoreductase [Nitrosomonadales bacterium]|tara:strand:+ start:2396 stop:2989 length:594 start_codon:yes stop_codon:yes gene_type:complete
MLEILVLYYSKGGSVKEMSKIIARGINSVDGVEAKLRTVPEVSPLTTQQEGKIPESGDLYANLSDLESCQGLVLGSPTRFGNMAAPLKYFIDSMSPIWIKGAMEDKPASVFTSSGSVHGGNESTLLSMQLPLLHLGMLIMGIPYSTPSLSSTVSGGTPYGSSHVGGDSNENDLTSDEKSICFAQGERIALLVKKING